MSEKYLVMLQNILPYFGLIVLLTARANALTVDHVPLVLARATPTSAKVTLFSEEKESTHSFHLTFDSHIGEPTHCDAPDGDLCLSWAKTAKLKVQRDSNGDSRSIHASSPVPMQMCFNLNGSHLYGGPISASEYPEVGNIVDLPYVTGQESGLVSLLTLERYWFSSSGLNIKVHPDSPLFVSQNSQQLCLTIKNEHPYPEDVPLILNYQSCIWRKNIRDAMLCFFQSYEKPVLPESVIASPIWNTWAEYSTHITQRNVQDYYSIIKSHNLRLSVISIDNGWEECYGGYTFNNSTFPDPKALVDLIHNDGHLVNLWVSPYILSTCNPLDEFAPYLIKYRNGTIGLTNFYGPAGITNFFDPQAAEWFEQRVLKIQKSFGFDSFMFFGGFASSILDFVNKPGLFQFQPNQFTRNFVKSAYKFGSLAEVQVGADSHQYTNGLLTIHNTASIWSAPNWGLPFVLQSVLELSVLGYGAILPGMIGGSTNMPTKELFIRWTQLNTFLPVMEFSLGPWHYDEETIEITRNCIELHYKYKDRILKEFNDLSHPVINPIWWIAPYDSIAQTIDSEFLLGEDLLVAPVLEKGAVSRDIYLPAGKWKDQNNGTVHEGPGYLRGYSAPLDVLPYFERITA